MLGPDAHGKGLCLEVHPLAVQGKKAVPGAVADGQHRHIAGQLLPIQLQAPQAALRQQQALGPCLKTDAAAQSLHFPPHGHHDAFQQVGADVRFGCLKGLVGRAVLLQQPQHQLAAVVSDARGELAVGISAGAALSELDVGLLAERSAPEKGLHIPVPQVHGPAPFQDHGAVAVFGQDQGGENARRAEAHDHRGRAQLFSSGRPGHDRRCAQLHVGIAAPADEGRLVPGQPQLHGADGFQPAVAQVQRLLVQAAPQNAVRTEPQFPSCGSQGFLLRKRKRKPDVR